MPTLHTAGPSGEQTFVVEGSEVVIGTDPSCAVRVKGTGVSPEHCKIQSVMGAWKVVDLESDDGTRVNGRFVNQHPLRTGDSLQVGDVRFVFRDERPAATEAAPAGPPPARAGAAPPARSATRGRARAGSASAGTARRSARGTDGGSPRAGDRVRRRPRKQSNPMPMVLGLLAGVAVIGVAVMMLSDSQSPTEAAFSKMQSAYRRNDWQGVLNAAQGADMHDADLGGRISDLVAQAKKNIASEAVAGKAGESVNAWNSIRLWLQKDNWKNHDEYVAKIDRFLEEYGDYGGAAVDMARNERARVAGSASSGTAANAKQGWTALEMDISALSKNGRFGDAIQKCEEFRNRFGSEDPRLGRQASDRAKQLRKDAEAWVGKQISRAYMKAEQGTNYQATKILKNAADNVGIPELSKRAMDKLDEILVEFKQ